ncbi:MAG: hypothetical protein Q7L19_05795 [Pseudohongiella sp.]|nr:hypothetical protein [Pseudohongiella sp.]
MSKRRARATLCVMKIFVQPWLALFLIFCLPAQALAAVLIECEQHITEAAQMQPGAHDSAHHDDTPSVAPDCHGALSERVSADFAEPAAETLPAYSAAGNTDSNSCFHCSGACQNLKPVSLISKAQQVPIFDNGAFSRFTQAPEAGIRNNPARPPCHPFHS